MEVGQVIALIKSFTHSLKSEINDVADDVSDIEDLLNGAPLPPVVTMPEGYKSANYSNGAQTNQFKWVNNQLKINNSNGESGEINTGTASLTIGDTLVYDVIPANAPKFKYSYENANEAGVVEIMLRFCRYDRYDYYDNGNITVPVGTGSQEIDLVQHATSKNIDLTERYRVIIRGLKLNTGAQSYSTATVWIDGYETDGGTGEGLTDRVDDLEDEMEDVGDDLENLTADLNAQKEKVSGLNTFLMRQNIPSYYFTDPVSPVSFDDYAYIEDAIARVPQGKSVIYLTDTHWESNKKNTFKLIQYVKNRLGISKVLFGGDCVNRGNTKYLGLNIIRAFMQEAVDALGGDFIPTIGNHDLNTGNALNDHLVYSTYRIPYDQIYKVFLSRVKGITTEDWSTTIASIAQSDADAAELTGWTKLHYHVDDAENQTRYIVLFASAYDGQIVPTYTGFPEDGGGGPTTVMQYEWFARTLMSTPAGYDIFVVTHCADAENKTFPERQLLRNYYDFFVRIASAFHKKCSGYKIDISNFDENKCPTNAFWTRETKQWDFSNAPTVGKILFLAGHLHYNVEYVSKITTDSTVYPTYDRGKARNNGNPALVGTAENVEVFDSSTVDFDKGEMLTIISQTDAYNRTETPHDYVYEKADMTVDTVTEQSFDVITLTDSGVICTRFGAGWDRTIPVKWLPTT